MEKSTTTAGVFPAAIVEEAWQQVGASFEQFCLTAGIAALAGMMEGDAARGDRLHRGADACPRLELGSAALSIGGKACGSTPRPPREERRGGDRRLVAAADPAAAGIARPSLSNGRPRGSLGGLGVNPSVTVISLVSTRRALWAPRST